MGKIVLTRGEIRNGWTPAALRKYLEECDASVNRIHALGSHAGKREPLKILSANEAHDELDW